MGQPLHRAAIGNKGADLVDQFGRCNQPALNDVGKTLPSGGPDTLGGSGHIKRHLKI